MLSADDHIILFHDDLLERVTGQDGLTAQTSFDVLRSLDAGSWFSGQYAREQIPTLAEAFDLLAELGLGAVVEIKPSEGRGVETGALVATAVRDRWPENLPPPLLSSFNEDSLAQARDLAPNVPRALNLYKSLDGWHDKMMEFDCVALHCLESLIEQSMVSAVIQAGYDLRCFTVNDPNRAQELKSWGVVSVFTDFPDRLFPKPAEPV